MADEPEFDAEALIRVLVEAEVRFVLIGGFAAVIHGSPYVTTDLDVVPETTPANFERLSEALDQLGARVWSQSTPEGLPFSHDAASLASVAIWNLVTDHGRLDVTLTPSGTAGFGDLIRDAEHLTIFGLGIDVASLADVVRSKEAADREKDRIVLPVLRRILSESRGQDPAS